MHCQLEQYDLTSAVVVGFGVYDDNQDTTNGSCASSILIRHVSKRELTVALYVFFVLHEAGGGAVP